MIRARTLVIPGNIHRRVEDHLFPGDGKEAAAILLCSRVQASGVKLLVREIILVPHESCLRSLNRLSWPGEYLDKALEASEIESLSIILIHSHPGCAYEFSLLDNQSDQDVIQSLNLARPSESAEQEVWNGSAIMIPGGAIKARLYDRGMHPYRVDLVAIYGDDFQFFWGNELRPRDRAMAFSEAMTQELSRLSVAIVGISGTGSLVAEQLLRMGVGELIVVDHDHVEQKNLNRILNTTCADAEQNSLKVDVFNATAVRIRPDARVNAVPVSIGTRAGIAAVAGADILFCCVDSEAGRHICDRLAAAMLQPLFDVGVSIPVRTPTRGMVISNISGRIDYVRPGGSTLMDRGVYTSESLAAESLCEVDPVAYANQVKEGYMPGAGQEAPSVICVNMHAASSVVLEFIARAYPFRLDGNVSFSRSEFDLVQGEYCHCADGTADGESFGILGTGMSSPLLGLPILEDCPS